MAKRPARSRREERRAARPSEQIGQPALPPSQRGTFRVFRAQQVLADTLPGVVRNRQAERRERQARRLSLAGDPAQSVQGAAQRSPRRQAERKQPDQPKLSDMKTCKTRPTRRQAKSGDGSSRPFVPWCS